MSTPRPRGTPLLTAFSPKLGRAVRVFNHAAFEQCVRLAVDREALPLPRCGAAAPYQINARLLGSPFRCAECRRPYAGWRARLAPQTASPERRRAITRARLGYRPQRQHQQCADRQKGGDKFASLPQHQLRSDTFASQTLETRVIAGFWQIRSSASMAE